MMMMLGREVGANGCLALGRGVAADEKPGVRQMRIVNNLDMTDDGFVSQFFYLKFQWDYG